MKRWLSLILALLMVLCLAGCSKAGAPAEQQPADDTSAADEAAAVAAAAEQEKQQPVEEAPVEESVDWTGRNPLTGEAVENDIAQNRPVMVMLNNLKQALPQSGNGQADIIYEILEEGGITRMLATYQDISAVEGNLGTIRSTRPYYVNIVSSMDGILVHAGGSGAAYNLIDDLGVTDMDALGGGAAGLFWRDKGRLSAGIAIEHTMYVTASDIANYLETSGVRTTHESGFAMKHAFIVYATPADGSDANLITVPFSGYKTGEFKYDAASGKYLVSEYGNPYMDATSNEQVSVKNVFIIMTKVSQIEGDNKGRLDVEMSGSGIGYYACGGKYVPINWSRASDTSMYEFTTMDGSPLNLSIGNSYVNIVPTTCSVSFVG